MARAVDARLLRPARDGIELVRPTTEYARSVVEQVETLGIDRDERRC